MTHSFEQHSVTPNQILQADLIEDAFAQAAAEHLGHWEQDSQSVRMVSEAEFLNEERVLFNLERLRCLFVKPLESYAALGKTEISFKDEQEQMHVWGDFINYIKQAAVEHRQFNILVTGLPISGKATLRRLITNELWEDYPHRACSELRNYR